MHILNIIMCKKIHRWHCIHLQQFYMIEMVPPYKAVQSGTSQDKRVTTDHCQQGILSADKGGKVKGRIKGIFIFNGV